MVRRDQTLKTRYRAIVSYTGLVWAMAGLVMFGPLFGLPAAPSEVHLLPWFLLPGTVLSVGGMLLWKVSRPQQSVTLGVRDGGVIVLLSWITVFVFSAVPFMGIQDFTFTQAVFESVSGWTTTGLTVVDESAAPALILLWRSIMQLAGGAGLAIIMVAALVGPTGPGLYAAEGRSQLVPHVRQSAKLVVVLYAGYALLGVAGYWAAGMTFFDAVNHSFAAVSTGGFSTHPDSIGHWNSALIESVSIPLMLLGNFNFVTVYVLVRGKVKSFIRNGEMRLLLVLIVACSAGLFAATAALYPTFGKGIRVAIFETVTAITTTGFSSTSYNSWDAVPFLVLIVLMVIGGGTCSTAGGIKQHRVYLLLRGLWSRLRAPFLPDNTVTRELIWEGDRKSYITDARLREVGMFVFLYLMVWTVGTLVLAAHGNGLQSSLFEFASAVGTVGLSTGLTSADSPVLVLWTETAGMFLGRLEFFIILVSLGKLAGDAFHVLAAGKRQR